mmetsp:Transcript_18263/g.40402  ORF Transcript_18263/g.40402 Transcript_18263/m.40402 type:complete len:341 (+) Transcript_18263:36-1058(+)|eukprot:CAMPEP_0204277402 /NCGR_PEP_ID=MMETSP0468-20130131/29275_1 /ASSEMBLY_ACC=CAM_ASM_000383 /TAXON_ID=2969 /ORGANISM="Oxyrrhis marina" /LENGTH=340 /DNA_ID=CAMNT_0051254167 /DNA_START=19 /DNA_END=1041 /DNA_ORIENTATION=+
MGSALSAPRFVLIDEQEAVGLGMRRLDLDTDVRRTVAIWEELGAPLGLTVQSFLATTGSLVDASEEWFRAMDTDRNHKVDVFEMLGTMVALAQGTVEAKLEVLFPIVDFSRRQRLNFDEVQILVGSICRGLHKVTGSPTLTPVEIQEVSRRLFDSHNVRYDSEITSRHLQRFLREDMEARAFVDRFQHAVALPAAQSEVQLRQKKQVAAFTSESRGQSTLSRATVASSELLGAELLSPVKDEWDVLFNCMGVDSDGLVRADRFEAALRPWNVFCVVDSGNERFLSMKELSVAMWVSSGKPPSEDEVTAMEIRLKGLGGSDVKFSRKSWMQLVLDGAVAVA